MTKQCTSKNIIINRIGCPNFIIFQICEDTVEVGNSLLADDG